MVWGWSRATTAAPPFERAGYSRGTYGSYAGDGYAAGGGGGGYGVGGSSYSQGGGSYSQGYSQPGVGGWSSAMHPAASSSYQGSHGGGGGFLESFSGLKSADNSAALSALTLLSFLFFLNMLQNQLLSSGSQTLVFTVGGGTGNGTFVGRRRRRRDADGEVWGLNFDTDHSNEYQQHLFEKFWVSEDELPDVVGADSGAGQPQTPCNVTAPRQDELIKLLPPHLAELFTKCREVVTCAFNHQAKPDDATASCARSAGAIPGECDEIVRALVPHEPK